MVLPAIPTGRRYTSIPIIIPANAYTVEQPCINQQSSDKHLTLSDSSGNVEPKSAHSIRPVQQTFGGQLKIATSVEQCSRTVEQAKPLPPAKSGFRRRMSQKISRLFRRNRSRKVSNVSNRRRRGSSRSQNNPAAGQDRSRPSPMGFDGTGDYYDNRTEKIKNNKPKEADHESDDSLQPLPLRLQKSVISQENRLPTHYSSSSSGQGRSTTTSSTMYSATTSSGNPSTGSSISKEAFRSITRDILSPDSAMFFTSMIGNFSPLEPEKYNPPPTATATESASCLEHSDP